MILNKFEKRKLIIKLHEEGKTIREIAHEAHASPRDISLIIKEYERQKENENKKHKLRNKPKRISKESKAFDLFVKGKTPIQVSIELDINCERTEELFQEFWRLSGLYELQNMYLKNRNVLPNITRLNSILQENNIKDEEIICTIKNATRLSVLENNLDITKYNLERTKETLNHYSNENKKLNRINFDLIEAINNNRNDSKTIENVLEYHKERLENIKKSIKEYKLDNDYKQIKNLVYPIAKDLTNNRLYIIGSIVEAVFEIIRNDAENKIILEYLGKKYYYNSTSIRYLENYFIPNKKGEIISKILKEIKIDLTDSVMETITN